MHYTHTVARKRQGWEVTVYLTFHNVPFQAWIADCVHLFPHCSVLKGYTIQHLPDGTVMVESIVIKVSSSPEETNTKVILLSWSYQVNCSRAEFCQPDKRLNQPAWHRCTNLVESHCEGASNMWLCVLQTLFVIYWTSESSIFCLGLTFKFCFHQDEDLGSFLSTLLKKGLPSGLWLND